MKREPSHSDYQKLIKKIGRLIRVEVDNKFTQTIQKSEDSVWTSAYLDSRWYSDAEGRITKLRAVLPDGKLVSIRSTDEISSLVDKIGEIKDIVFPEKWYGLMLTVFPNGKSEILLDSDPNCCIADPLWFET